MRRSQPFITAPLFVTAPRHKGFGAYLNGADAFSEVAVTETSTSLDETVRSLVERVFIRCVPIEICAGAFGVMTPAMNRRAISCTARPTSPVARPLGE